MRGVRPPTVVSARAEAASGAVEHRLDVPVVVRAAADVADQALADLVPGGVRDVVEQGAGRHQLARGAEPALRAVVLDEPLLQRAQLVAVGQPLDRGHLPAVGPDRELAAGVDGGAVEPDRAGAALASVAADLGPCQTQVVAQNLGQCPTVLDLEVVCLAVDTQRNPRAWSGVSRLVVDLLRCATHLQRGQGRGCGERPCAFDERASRDAAHAWLEPP